MKRQTITMGYGKQATQLRVEFPGGAISIDVDRYAANGHKAAVVLVQANGNLHPGEKHWWINGDEGVSEQSITIIEGK